MGENEKKEGTQPKYEEGALKIHKLTQAEAFFSVVGCGIGSGCLGTAYSARLAGLPVLVFWFIVTGILTLFFHDVCGRDYAQDENTGAASRTGGAVSGASRLHPDIYCGSN